MLIIVIHLGLNMLCPYPCSQCLCDILVHNSSIEKLQLNSTDLGDEVSLVISIIQRELPTFH